MFGDASPATIGATSLVPPREPLKFALKQNNPPSAATRQYPLDSRGSVTECDRGVPYSSTRPCVSVVRSLTNPRATRTRPLLSKPTPARRCVNSRLVVNDHRPVPGL